MSCTAGRRASLGTPIGTILWPESIASYVIKWSGHFSAISKAIENAIMKTCNAVTGFFFF